MSLIVTLDVYSCRPNPTWVLPDRAATSFQQLVDRIPDTSNLKPASIFGGLGYRGFSLRRSELAAQETIVYGGIVDCGSAHPSLCARDRELERWLLDSAGDHITREVNAHVSQALDTPVDHRAMEGQHISPAGCTKCRAVDAPRFRPALWNAPGVQQQNSSYNYANDRMTNTFAQPGRASGVAEAATDREDYVASAQLDGLATTSDFSAPLAAGQGWYVGLVIWPGNDCHWYRQDTFGCWSHKPGTTSVRITDNGGTPIADPRTCDRGPYSEFRAYMITNTRVRVE